MENTNKILIIVVIILVGVLGIVGGYLLQGYFVKTNNSTVNQTNSSLNTTDNTTANNNESSNISDYISEGDAINIAKAYLNINEPYTVRAIFYYDEGDKPALWKIFFYSSKTQKCLGFANVNARTGNII